MCCVDVAMEEIERWFYRVSHAEGSSVETYD